jgi:hypothetical protein
MASSLRTRVTRTFSCTSIAGNGFKTLEEGARVTYEATQDRMGMQADNVSRVKPARPSVHSRINGQNAGAESPGLYTVLGRAFLLSSILIHAALASHP